ncbi:MAG: F0F1 ATP synthase subunit delta [Candidatus Spechtbacterales bacterium]|nr:F0F1 ATP synthase subunit delta [Candidatus Spechtbacterales bacterium]
MLKTEDIAKALISLLEDDKKSAEEPADKFWEFAQRYNLEGRASGVLFHLEAELERQKEKNKAYITLAQPTSDEQVEKIKEIIGASNTDTELVQDKNLIAGFRARYKDKMYEANVKNNIEKLKQVLSSA